MRWALMMIRLATACRNTSVRRTTGTAPEPMMSASTCPGPTEGNWSISPTINSAALSGVAFNSACIVDHRGLGDDEQSAVEGIFSIAFEPAALGIDFQEPVNRLRLEARRFGHALRCAARWGAKQ